MREPIRGAACALAWSVIAGCTASAGPAPASNGAGGKADDHEAPAEPPAERDGGVPGDAAPRITALFTAPGCPEHTVTVDGEEYRVPEGVRCYVRENYHWGQINTFARTAGVRDKLAEWLEDAIRAKEENPDRPVSVTLAYLTWSDRSVQDELCRATSAGVRVVAFLDRAHGGRQIGQLLDNAACDPENVEVHYLGGRTSHPGWRLMHIKMLMIEDGSEPTRLAVGSANLTSFGLSMHFESWVFAEFPSDSHFVAAHRCAADALREAEQVAHPDDAEAFETHYDACLAAIDAEPDPRYQVFFTPDRDGSAKRALIERIEESDQSVDMAIQHFTAWDLGRSLRDRSVPGDAAVRLVLDDDTFYGEGEAASMDSSLYRSLIRDSGVDSRFLQTNAYIARAVGSGAKQYQHNKYVVIDGSTVFFGAGNFTGEAFRTNYENFYLFDDETLARSFTDHFAGLFERAQPADALPPRSDF